MYYYSRWGGLKASRESNIEKIEKANDELLKYDKQLDSIYDGVVDGWRGLTVAINQLMDTHLIAEQDIDDLREEYESLFTKLDEAQEFINRAMSKQEDMITTLEEE